MLLHPLLPGADPASALLQVITVPAHFNERQRAATAEAGALGGLKRVRLLQGMPDRPLLQTSALCIAQRSFMQQPQLVFCKAWEWSSSKLSVRVTWDDVQSPWRL